MWLEYAQVFNTLSHSPDIRCIILSGAGPTFTVGLDVKKGNLTFPGSDGARKAWEIKRRLTEFQECISASEKCEKRSSPPPPSPLPLGSPWANRQANPSRDLCPSRLLPGPRHRHGLHNRHPHLKRRRQTLCQRGRHRTSS